MHRARGRVKEEGWHCRHTDEILLFHRSAGIVNSCPTVRCFFGVAQFHESNISPSHSLPRWHGKNRLFQCLTRSSFIHVFTSDSNRLDRQPRHTSDPVVPRKFPAAPPGGIFRHSEPGPTTAYDDARHSFTDSSPWLAGHDCSCSDGGKPACR